MFCKYLYVFPLLKVTFLDVIKLLVEDIAFDIQKVTSAASCIIETCEEYFEV